MIQRMLATAVLSISLSSSGSAAESVIVRVTDGELRGTHAGKTGAVFKGIPFAAPPVGDLRWQEPQPVRHWEGTKDAVNFGPACAQNPLSLMPGLDKGSSEDCLYLNVWTSEWPIRKKKPVMLWVHGGGLTAGSASEMLYDGESLARRGVIVVSSNYRLGLFGFFAHPSLTAESSHHTSGNQGVLDLIAALRWVHENISKFGGDPNNVLQIAPGPPNPQYDSIDRKISQMMQGYWTNFAKTGNPNEGKLPRWPAYEMNSRSYLAFTDEKPVAREGLRRPFCDLFIQNVNRQMEVTQ